MDKEHQTSSHIGWDGAPQNCLYCKSGLYSPELGDENNWLVCGSCGDGYPIKEHDERKLK